MPDDLEKAELEAKVQTYEHIDKIREMLRLFANELLARGETHDRSKLKPAESKVFAEYTPKLKNSTYMSDEYKGFLAGMKPALDHHYANNRHHPEHHGPNGIDEMNLLDVMEMWIDWYCSSMRHANGDMRTSIEKNRERFRMSPQLARIFHRTLVDFQEGCLSTTKPQIPFVPLPPVSKEKQAWDVVYEGADKALGTVWAHTEKGARFYAHEYFGTGDPQNDSRLTVRLSSRQRPQPIDPDDPQPN